MIYVTFVCYYGEEHAKWRHLLPIDHGHSAVFDVESGRGQQNTFGSVGSLKRSDLL